MEYLAALALLSVLLFGGIFLAWGRRPAGLAMAGVAALALIAFLGLALWQSSLGLRFRTWRVDAHVAQQANEFREAHKERFDCMDSGGSWTWDTSDPEDPGRCMSAQEEARRIATDPDFAQRREESRERLRRQRELLDRAVTDLKREGAQ